ncbi:hypothetical protein ACFPGO_02575 [Arcanobacterium canis]|uniref:DUF3311 domain-containing protein n=1 Tax=Arcanobacterium canis TaxID=999183 RepID=A0ABY8FZI5_9ACTO|nr:hypothetical protein [Arcanobacterium canis]WFM83150.1 hypothetical protein P7079_07075 [Arcanobacterium canis]
MAKNTRKEPSLFRAVVFSVLLLLILPLPLTLWFTGTEWILNGSKDVPLEFFWWYLGQLIFFCGWVAVIKWKENHDH